jgi:hypothetical protein
MCYNALHQLTKGTNQMARCVYGFAYEDLTGEAGSGVNNVVYDAVGKATINAREAADSVVEELNEYDDGAYGPYEVEVGEQGNGMPQFTVINGNGYAVEMFSVVEFILD